MKLRNKTPRPTYDGRGQKFCHHCGTAMEWSSQWQDGFSGKTGEPSFYHQWVCPKWPEQPGKHTTGPNVSVDYRL